MQGLDAAVLLWMNRLARESWTFDAFVMMVAWTSLLKGGVLVALLWWTWERAGTARSAPGIVVTSAAVLVAVAISRVMQNFLPGRLRPMHDPDLAGAGFVLPYDVPADMLHDWSSFPSDNAGLAFALSTAVFLRHRGAGLFAYAWSLVVICLPRIYTGFHYPSDIIGGALIGIGVVAAASRLRLPARLEDRVARWSQAHRGLFYAGLFLLTYQMATVFEDARDIAGFAKLVFAAAWQRL